MINLGNIELSKMYLGNAEVQKAYLGTEQIYPSQVVSYYGYLPDGLKYFWDGIDKGRNAGGWTDLVSGLYLASTGATSLAKGWRVDDDASYLGGTGVSIDAPLDTSTIEFVFKERTHASNYGFIFYPSGTTNIAGILFTNRLIIGVSPNTYRYTLANPQEDVMHSISASKARAYFNGGALSYASSSGNPASTNGTWMFSRESLGSYHSFRGDIYCVRIYDKQLTEAEVIDNYAADKVRYFGVQPIQIVQNGDFANGLDEWTSHYCCTATTENVGIKLTKNKSTGYGAIEYQAPSGLNSAHQYYQKVVMKKGTETAYAGFCTSSFTVGGNTQMYSDATSDWEVMDQITSPAAASNRTCLRVGASSSATGVYAFFKSFMMIDLTATFGAGNEPSIDACRRIFPDDYYPYNV